MAILWWIVPLYEIVPLWVWTFLKNVWKLLTNYLSMFITINASLILMHMQLRLWICLHFPESLFFSFCSTVYQQPFLLLSPSTCSCWFCLCTWVSFIYKTNTIYIESYLFSPVRIRKFLSLDCYCKLQSHLTVLCCELSFPALMKLILFSILDTSYCSVTGIF